MSHYLVIISLDVDLIGFEHPWAPRSEPGFTLDDDIILSSILTPPCDSMFVLDHFNKDAVLELLWIFDRNATCFQLIM